MLFFLRVSVSSNACQIEGVVWPETGASRHSKKNHTLNHEFNNRNTLEHLKEAPKHPKQNILNQTPETPNQKP